MDQQQSQNSSVERRFHVSCTLSAAFFHIRFVVLLGLLDLIFGIINITFSWADVKAYLGEKRDGECWFTAGYVPGNTTQRLLPAVQALYGIGIVLSIFSVAVVWIDWAHPAGNITPVPRGSLVLVGILITNIILSAAARAIGEIIIEVPLNVPAVIARFPDETPQTVHAAYNYWVHQSRIMAMTILGLSISKLLFLALRFSLGYIHWTARHEKTRGLQNNRDGAAIHVDHIQVGRTGPLASLFESHEALRARALPTWMIQDE
ncbi:hypothetical protein F4680DRAFT_439544 [Xylaria scruposa]|nr:hypothetical protein F4680DRAFT_439544 [Xylaria scruposa]